MSLSTFLESQNKDLLNSLYEWQEKVRQYSVVIDAKNKRVAELEELLNDTKRQNNFLFIQKGELESEAAHWKSNHDEQLKVKRQLLDRPDLQDEAHDLKEAVKKFLDMARVKFTCEDGTCFEGDIWVVLESDLKELEEISNI